MGLQNGMERRDFFQPQAHFYIVYIGGGEMNDSPNKIPCSSSLHGYGRTAVRRISETGISPHSSTHSPSPSPPSGLIIMPPPREIENPLAIEDCWARGAGFIHPLLQGNFVKTVSISKCWANYVPRYAYGTYVHRSKTSFQRRERRRRKRKRERECRVLIQT